MDDRKEIELGEVRHSVESDDSPIDNSSVADSDADDNPTIQEPSILNKMYRGAGFVGGGAVSAAKAVGSFGFGIVKGAYRHTGNALHSASLASGLDHVINPSLPLSPKAADRKLSKYSKSYDLAGFMKIAEETSKKLGEVKSVPYTSKADGTRPLDLYKLGSIGTSIKATVERDGDGARDATQTIAEAIGDISAESKLTGPDGLQGKFHALYDEIKKKDSDTFHTPAQIIEAFKELQAETLQKLQEQKQAAIAKIKEVLEPKDAEDLSNNTKNFARLCGINPDPVPPITLPQIKTQIKAKVNQLIAEVEKEYAKAEKSVNEHFDGTPSTGKDNPAVPSLTEKLGYEKEKAEADLLLRISHLERMLKRGYDISYTDKQGGKGLTTADDDEDTEHLRAGCLKGVTLKRLLDEEKWAGKYWGQNQVNTLHTRNGLVLVYDKDTKSVTGLKIPPQWFLTDVQWEEKVQLGLEDYISALKIDQKPGEKLALTITHTVDSNRLMLIQATYRAAIKNGYKPEDIVLTVTGSKEEKGNFSKKPALEVLSACGLSNDVPDSAKYEQERSELKQRNPEQQKAIQRAVKTLKFDPAKKIDEFKPDDENLAPDAGAPRIR